MWTVDHVSYGPPRRSNNFVRSGAISTALACSVIINRLVRRSVHAYCKEKKKKKVSTSGAIVPLSNHCQKEKQHKKWLQYELSTYTWEPQLCTLTPPRDRKNDNVSLKSETPREHSCGHRCKLVGVVLWSNQSQSKELIPIQSQILCQIVEPLSIGIFVRFVSPFYSPNAIDWISYVIPTNQCLLERSPMHSIR